MRKAIIFAVLGVLMAVFAMSGCSTVPKTVAVVNGVEISGEDYTTALNGFLANYGLTEETMSDTLGLTETVEYKNNVIDEMVLQELMLQYAEDNGLTALSDEDSAEIDAKVESYLNNLKESFAADVENEGKLQGEAAEREAAERYDDYIRTYGYTEENLKTQYTKQLILDRVYDDVMADCIVTSEDIQEYYDQRLAAEQEMEKTDPDALFELYLDPGDSVNVYTPQKAHDEVRFVKHILVQIPSDVSAQISELEAAGDQDGADKLREQAMAELKEKADGILAQAKSGADFDELISEYNEDPGVDYMPDGYQVYEGASFDAAFLEDALSLESIGDISDAPVESSFGYHIIKFVSVPEAGPIPFTDVEDEIAQTLQSEKQTEHWEEAVSSWEESAAIEKHQFRTQA